MTVTNVFGVAAAKGNQMLIRKEYTSVSTHLIKLMRNAHATATFGQAMCVFLTGTPGIGKSLFVALYFLPEVWRQREALDIDRIVYQSDGELFVLNCDGCAMYNGQAKYSLGGNTEALDRTMAVLDLQGSNEFIRQHVIKRSRYLLLVGSPGASSGVYPSLIRKLNQMRVMYMAPFTEKELVRLGKHLGVREDVVKLRFKTCGGSARLVLSNGAGGADPLQLMNGTLANAIRKQCKSIDAREMLDSVGNGSTLVLDNNFTNAVSHHIFHVFPSNRARTSVKLRIASHRLAAILGEKMGAGAMRSLMGMYVDALNNKNHKLAGDLWESYVICRLTHGERRFDARRQRSPDSTDWSTRTRTVTWPSRLKTRYYTSPFKGPIEEGVLYVPHSSTEPVLDFFWQASMGCSAIVVFGQATIAHTHKLKNAANAFGAVLQAVDTGELPRVLMSLVPSVENFQVMRPQDAQRWARQGIDQYAWVHATG